MSSSAWCMTSFINVTGSSFEVTFVTLTDVVVTGVWNEELGRIEF